MEEFGFGFPPRLFSVKRGETVYSFNAIPIGGFVRLFGEDGENKNYESGIMNQELNEAFFNKKVWEKVAIVAAGVTMNVILAVFLLGLGHWLGIPTVLDDNNRVSAENRMIQVVQVASDSPAEKSGIKIGDSILKSKINPLAGGQKSKIDDFANITQVQEFIDSHRGEEIILTTKRGNQEREIKITPRMSPPEGEGAIGIVMSEVGFIRYPWYIAIWKGVESVFFIFLTIITVVGGIIKSLIAGRPIPDGVDLGGPVYIAMLTRQFTQLGLVYILQFAAVISINLALINIFPFPALDGGRIMFLFLEKIKGSPVNPKVEGIIHRIGFALLILLIVFITFRDVVRLF